MFAMAILSGSGALIVSFIRRSWFPPGVQIGT